VATFERDQEAVLLSELVGANIELRAEVKALQTHRESYANEDRRAVMEGLVAELNSVRVVNGLVEVSGPGVELLVDGPLSALDIQDLINELRNSGAEAIALNGHRLVARSVLTVNARGRISTDGQSVDRPYRFEAIGDPDTIEPALLRPGGLVSVLDRTYPNLIVTSMPRARLVLGIYRYQAPLEYARPLN
jgi:uncharacterized protein YlxW (UPF0749 family)